MLLASFVTTRPEVLSAAAHDLGGIGVALAAANSGAAGPTAGVVPAAADQVSVLTAAQFAGYAENYQAVAAAAAVIHSSLVSTLAANATSYAAAEAANVIAAG